ncbi:hypothetical protein E2C01_098067 [Portunus trituberculatus]|uniref:Uncharacterized protein n=1 Tax=Portunus trituberculatus TaxID=210409 RepID=A0A5B7K648_PORTR|nr:hypothetical protein [Portunus trituberculatus]
MRAATPWRRDSSPVRTRFFPSS